MRTFKNHIWQKTTTLLVTGSLLTLAVVPLTTTTAHAATAGTVKSYPISAPSATPYSITNGPDGNLWFTDYTNDTVNRITPTGVITSFSDGKLGNPQGITSGQDGNLWIANARNTGPGGSGCITRLSVLGTTTDFCDPTINNAGFIASGNDGARWFTNTNGNSIGRITAAGVVTNFTSPSLGYPEGITSGPDGNMWFVNFNGGVGSITPFGVFTSYSVPGMTRGISITTGPDGALWFTYGGAPGNVGRITTDGTVTTFDGGGVFVNPQTITSGPDGNLWIANGNNVVQMTTSGVATVFSDASMASVIGITTGADNSMWFTSHNSSTSSASIGSISTSATIAPSLTPVVTSVTPNTGPTSGGTSVTVNGVNLANASRVDFGFNNSSQIVSDTDTQIVVNNSNSSAGVVDVTVTTPNGTSPTTPADQFTYTPPVVVPPSGPAPIVSSVVPNTGPTSGGTSVIINGSNLANASRVDFGFNNSSQIVSDTDTQIVVNNSSSNPGVVDVTVTTPGGVSATSSSDQFTYVAPHVNVPIIVTVQSNTTSEGPYSPDNVAASWIDNGNGPYTGTLDFGDGSPVLAINSQNYHCDSGYSINSCYVNSPIHTYYGAGSYTATLTISDSAGNSGSGSGVQTVSDQPITFYGQQPSPFIENVPGYGNGAIATFQDKGTDALNPNSGINTGDTVSGPGKEYSGTVSYGDGTPPEALWLRSAGGSSVWVQSTHTYLEEGTYTTTITVYENSNPSNATVYTAPVVVSDGNAYTYDKAYAQNATAGTPISVQNMFVEQVPTATADDFTPSIINWGDGTTTSATVSSLYQLDSQEMAINLKGTHTYAQPGTYSGSVIFKDVGGGTSSVPFTMNVASGNRLTLTCPSSVASSPSDGVNSTFTVCQLTDSNTADTASNLSGVVTLGDGSTTNPTFTQTSPGHFNVQVNHTYAQPGTYSLGISVNNGVTTTTGSTRLTVTESPLTNGSGTTSSMKEGVSGTPTLGSFSDTNPTSQASEYSATINWGDGTPTSVGIITKASNGTFSVSGTHTYAKAGTYTTSIAVKDTDGASLNFNGTVNVLAPSAATLSLSGNSTDAVGSTDTLTATALDAQGKAVAGVKIYFTVSGANSANGSAITNTQGQATFTYTGGHAGADTINAFADNNRNGSQDSGEPTASSATFWYTAFTGNGSFVIGDKNAAIGSTVTFWSAQWSKANPLSGGSAPDSFKGFESSSNASCGLLSPSNSSWTAGPGNSAGPPATIPLYMEVIVTSNVTKSGSTISGNETKIVIVKTNPGYANNPGSTGTGVVVAWAC